MAPSKELCKQIKTNISELTVSCRREVRYIDVSPQVPLEAQRPLLVGKTKFILFVIQVIVLMLGITFFKSPNLPGLQICYPQYPLSE